ncbi:MAG TPA: adenylate/guanylate cyclase domain-containing protein [Zeimonas sp.]
MPGPETNRRTREGASIFVWMRRLRDAAFAGRSRRSASMLALALLVGVVVYALDGRGPLLRSVEHALRDGFVRMLVERTPDPRIGLVDIDEESLRRSGPWPWPRRLLADLVERLVSTHGAALVVLDLVLPEPAAGNDASGDLRLAALARERLLVSAQAFDYVRRELPVRTGVPGGAFAHVDALPAVAATGHVAGFAGLAAQGCVGNVGFAPDADGQVRRLPLLTEWRGERYPTLALAALSCVRDDLDYAAIVRALPVDGEGQWQLRYGRDPSAFDALPAHAVFDADAAHAALRGRIVLVGSSALGLSDRVATPLASSVAGVLVHAGALGDLLDAEARQARGGFAWSVALALPVALAWLLVSTLLLWRAIGRAHRLHAIAAALVLALGGWLALSLWIVDGGRPLPVSAPLWSYAFLMLVQLPFEWSAAQSRVRARTRLLSRYVARPVLDELLARETDDPLSTRHAEISVLIADMQDYTRMTAHSTLEETAALTRGFLDCLTRPVLEGMGTLDKYTGDGLVAFWGAPLPVTDHAPRALRAALGILATVEHFNRRRVARGELPVRVRIGLATGRALVGDLGTPFRSTYTAVGDVINLASRLQQAARDFDDDIVASHAFAEACPHTVFRPIGAISPRGLQREEVFSPQRASGDAGGDPTGGAPDEPPGGLSGRRPARSVFGETA